MGDYQNCVVEKSIQVCFFSMSESVFDFLVLRVQFLYFLLGWDSQLDFRGRQFWPGDLWGLLAFLVLEYVAIARDPNFLNLASLYRKNYRPKIKWKLVSATDGKDIRADIKDLVERCLVMKHPLG